MKPVEWAELQAQVKWSSDLAEKLKATNNIWTALEVLTNATGAECGSHLETLLCKELNKQARN